MAAIADGIIAVAATILIIELEVPDDITLTSDLVLHWSRITGSWVISFMMIVVVWFDNHFFLSKAKQWSVSLTMLTFLQLGAVSFIPFASNLVIDHYESHAAMLAFNAAMVANALASFALCRRLAASTYLIDGAAMAARIRVRGFAHLSIYLFVTLLSILAGYYHHSVAGVGIWILAPLLIVLENILADRKGTS